MRIRPRCLLALLLAVSAHAQPKGVSAKAAAVPAILTSMPVAAMAAAPILPSSMITPAAPTVLASVMTAPQAPVVSPPANRQQNGAGNKQAAPPAKPLQNPAPATPTDGWASRLNFKPGQEFFDGGTPRSNEGAVFSAVPKPDGTVRVHLVDRGPLAAVRPVAGTQGLSGRALFDKVAAIEALRQRFHTYQESSRALFAKADNILINGVAGVVDAYSGIFVPGSSDQGDSYLEEGDINGDGFQDKQGMNVEHVEPQSLFDKASPMREDVHIQMATFQHPNSVRGNLPLGMVVGKPDYENKAGAKRGLDAHGVYVFEPPDAVKGRVARALLYFNTRYKGTRTYPAALFWNREIDVMLRWNREHPPDAFEARRNDIVESFQGNRNAFVDDPGLADRIGAEALKAGPPARAPRSSRSNLN